MSELDLYIQKRRYLLSLYIKLETETLFITILVSLILEISREMEQEKRTVVREVWGANLEDELRLLRRCLGRFRLASFDTEFPGSIFTTRIPFSKLSPSQLYQLMKQNVDSLKLIQLGITLSDIHGNLPSFSTEFRYVWQFNFRDFDPECDPHDPESITLLQSQGIDFAKNREMGIDPPTFAFKFREYGLGWNSGLTWITFHGLYDYGYLIKILTANGQLPSSYEEFTMLKQGIFGFVLHDTKDMAKQLQLYGGLENIAKRLNVSRAAGKSHQAGSDSLLTMHVFLQLMRFVPTPVSVVRFYGNTQFCTMNYCKVVPVPHRNVVPIPHCNVVPPILQ